MSEIKAEQFEIYETRRVAVSRLRVTMSVKQMVNLLRPALIEIHSAFDRDDIQVDFLGGYCDENPDTVEFKVDLEVIG